MVSEYILISGYTLTRYHLKVLHWSFFLKAFLSDISPISIPESCTYNKGEKSRKDISELTISLTAKMTMTEDIYLSVSGCKVCLLPTHTPQVLQFNVIQVTMAQSLSESPLVNGTTPTDLSGV